MKNRLSILDSLFFLADKMHFRLYGNKERYQKNIFVSIETVSFDCYIYPLLTSKEK